MKVSLNDIKILNVEECGDYDYGLSVVKYSIGNDFVSYIFSEQPHDEYEEESILSEIISHIEENKGIGSYPKWSDLSPTLLYLVEDSCWDMKFVDYDNEDWNETKANEILVEAGQYTSLDNVIEPGDADGAYITVFADAMNSVNWYGHPYGIKED